MQIIYLDSKGNSLNVIDGPNKADVTSILNATQVFLNISLAPNDKIIFSKDKACVIVKNLNTLVAFKQKAKEFKEDHGF